MPSLPPSRLVRRRRAAVLTAVALLVPGTAVTASAAPASAAPGSTVAAAPVELPTSWPAVPVSERLQPWLSERLTTAGDEQLRVMVSGETTAAATAAVAAAGLAVQQTWDKVGVVVAFGTPSQIEAVVGQPGVTAVEGDQPLAYTLDTAHQATRSDQALATYKTPEGGRIDGSGITIAVIDSGIDGTHPMFTDAEGASKVVQNRKNMCGATIVPSTNESCFQEPPVNDTDTQSGGGHGTHVAGIAAGFEVTTPEGVDLRGSAPGAKLVGLSVGAAIGLIDSNAAMTWVVDHQRKPCASAAAQQEGDIDPACPPIRVTNHSYGPATAPEGGFEFDPDSVTVRIQEVLVSQGVTPVWAAGNSAGDGSIAQTNPPGMDPRPGVLMVASYNDGGAGNRDNQLSGFSSRGKNGDPTTYPDLSAPGDLITSSCRPTLAVCQGAPSYDGGNYQTISGTSMATPYVAGVVAQLAQGDPANTPAKTEDLLEDSAHKFVAGGAYEPDPGRNDDDTTSFDKGHGLVDVAAALGTQQNAAIPPAPAPICTSRSAQVVDPEGDATGIIAVDANPESQSDLDVKQAFLTWDSAKKELTFHIRVSDLAGAPGDEFFRFYVSRDTDAEVFAVANRDAATESFLIRQFDSGASTTVTGAFDEEANEVRIVLPAAQYAEVIPDKTLADGDMIGVGQVLGQRDTGVITATADTASGSCPFTVAESNGAVPAPGVRTIENACPEGDVPADSRKDDDGNLHEPSIDCVVWWGIASGTSSEMYGPDAGVTREQMASFVAQLIEKSGGELPQDAEDAFGDDGGSKHEANINKLAAVGIVSGRGGDRYEPRAVVSRDQMATFLVSAYEHVSELTLAASGDYFGDDEGNVHEDAINKAAAAGFTGGRGAGFEPRGSVLRDQMASFLSRSLDLLVAEGTTEPKA